MHRSSGERASTRWVGSSEVLGGVPEVLGGVPEPLRAWTELLGGVPEPLRAWAEVLRGVRKRWGAPCEVLRRFAATASSWLVEGGSRRPRTSSVREAEVLPRV